MLRVEDAGARIGNRECRRAEGMTTHLVLLADADGVHAVVAGAAHYVTQVLVRRDLVS